MSFVNNLSNENKTILNNYINQQEEKLANCSLSLTGKNSSQLNCLKNKGFDYASYLAGPTGGLVGSIALQVGKNLIDEEIGATVSALADDILFSNYPELTIIKDSIAFVGPYVLEALAPVAGEFLSNTIVSRVKDKFASPNKPPKVKDIIFKNKNGSLVDSNHRALSEKDIKDVGTAQLKTTIAKRIKKQPTNKLNNYVENTISATKLSSKEKKKIDHGIATLQSLNVFKEQKPIEEMIDIIAIHSLDTQIKKETRKLSTIDPRKKSSFLNLPIQKIFKRTQP
jgi:hypothetical protein